jgi:hypothetical protein
MLRESEQKGHASGQKFIPSLRNVPLCDVDTGVSYVELYESTKVVVVVVVVEIVVVVVQVVVIIVVEVVVVIVLEVVVVVVGGGGEGRGGGHNVSLTLSLSTGLSLEIYHIRSLNPAGNLDSSFFLLRFYFPYFIEDYRNTEPRHLC